MDGIFLDNVFRVLEKKKKEKKSPLFRVLILVFFSFRLFASEIYFCDVERRFVRERERERESAHTRARKEESDFLFALLLLLLLLLLLFDISLTFYRYKRERERERIGCGEKPPPKRRG